MWATIQSFLSSTIVPWLKLGLDPWHALLNALPSPVWRLAVCLYLLVGSLWVIALRRQFVYAGAPDHARWRDLRLWIPFLLIPYLLVYLLF
jgi:hypothetical protein